MRLRILSRVRFAGTVATGVADGGRRVECRCDVLERPEFLDYIALHDLQAGEPVAGLACEVSRVAGKDATQSSLALGLGTVVTDEVGLGQVFDLDGLH